jgi:hypothetical protein
MIRICKLNFKGWILIDCHYYFTILILFSLIPDISELYQLSSTLQHLLLTEHT